MQCVHAMPCMQVGETGLYAPGRVECSWNKLQCCIHIKRIPKILDIMGTSE